MRQGIGGAVCMVLRPKTVPTTPHDHQVWIMTFPGVRERAVEGRVEGTGGVAEPLGTRVCHRDCPRAALAPGSDWRQPRAGPFGALAVDVAFLGFGVVVPDRYFFLHLMGMAGWRYRLRAPWRVTPRENPIMAQVAPSRRARSTARLILSSMSWRSCTASMISRNAVPS